MVVVLLIIAGLVAWFFIAAIARANARLAYADQRGAELELDEIDEPHLKPTWSFRQDRLREFVHALGTLAQRRMVPQRYVQELLDDEDFIARLMHLAAIMDRRGSSFSAQKIAAADYVSGEWLNVPVNLRAGYIKMELDRLHGR